MDLVVEIGWVLVEELEGSVDGGPVGSLEIAGAFVGTGSGFDRCQGPLPHSLSGGYLWGSQVGVSHNGSLDWRRRKGDGPYRSVAAEDEEPYSRVRVRVTVPRQLITSCLPHVNG